MTPHEARARETREWLAKAAEDVASARSLIDTAHLANALFFCQQAAEKSVKAFLTWHNRIFPKTHDLKELGEDCQKLDPSLSSLMKEAQVLTDYAWKLRYPGGGYVPGPDEVESMYALAARVVSEIKSRLP